MGPDVSATEDDDAPTEATSSTGPADSSFEAFFDLEALGQVKRAALLLGSNEDANDVVQEAFARVYARWDDIGELGPYLNRVVLNLCRDHARRRGTVRRSLPRLVTAGEDAVTEVLDDVLDRLPFNQRAAVVLRFWAGLSNEQIAAELDCPVGSVGPWISRALATMREELE